MLPSRFLLDFFMDPEVAGNVWAVITQETTPYSL
jgi:hypothetical protein